MNESSQRLWDERYRQFNAYRDDPAYRKLVGHEARVAYFARHVGARWEIDEAIYNEFLNILPPLGWRGDSFYLCEFLFDDITHRFSREGERFFCEVAYYPPRPAAKMGGSSTRPRGPEPD